MSHEIELQLLKHLGKTSRQENRWKCDYELLCLFLSPLSCNSSPFTSTMNISAILFYTNLMSFLLSAWNFQTKSVSIREKLTVTTITYTLISEPPSVYLKYT